MSAVRMCDGCGLIFREGEEGSSVGTVIVNRRNDRGKLVPEQVVQDRCAGCNGIYENPRPRLSITSIENTDLLPQ